MSSFNRVVHEVLVIEGYFQYLINVSKVSIQNFGEVVQLATDSAG